MYRASILPKRNGSAPTGSEAGNSGEAHRWGGVTNRAAPLKVSSGAAAACARDDRQSTAKTAARSGANRAQRGGRSERLVARGEEFTVTAHNVPGISDYVGDWAACKEPGTTGFKFGSDFSIFTECHGAQAKK